MILVISAEMKKKWKAFLLAYAQDFIAERFCLLVNKDGTGFAFFKFGFINQSGEVVVQILERFV